MKILSLTIALAITAQWSYAQQIVPSGIYGAANNTTVGNLSVNWVIGTLTPTSISALPVKLISFKGYLTKTGDAELNWKTAQEVNNAGFEIQKSTDGKQYDAIGWVDGGGNHEGEKTYRFVDQSLTTTSYYRLKQLDLDGKFTLSRIVAVIPEAESLERLSSYPNPSSNGTVHVQVPRNTALLTVTDKQGRTLIEQENPPFQQAIQLPNTGVYILRVQTKAGAGTLKLVRN
ncbi:MAG: T9SS type A sorting domain-containing protein [Dyadobacter sp.]|uniref:T9SS type A sorting domain-containing protein n=1 Tax=Dyadobacter sp. TaxID=1914288 RepID=UPI003266EA6D